MKTRLFQPLLRLLPALVSALALGRATGDYRLATVLAALASILAAMGPRWELDRGRQFVASAMGAGAGYALAALLYDRQAGALGDGWTRVAAAAILAAGARFVVVRPRGGPMGTVAVLFAGLIATGETHVGGYVAFAVLFLLTSLASIAVSDKHSPGPSHHAPRLAIGGAILLASSGVAAGAAVGLRGAYLFITHRMHPSAFVWRPRVGFSDQMDLGALDGLLDSDTIVLRVHGSHVDYLRGAAMDVYAAGRWIKSKGADVQIPANYDREPSSHGDAQIAAVSERTDRFFLPLDAHLIGTAPAAVLIDGVGAIKRFASHGVNVAYVSRAQQDSVGPPPPRTADLLLPRTIRSRLESLAAEWTHGATEPVDKLDAIEKRLGSEFRYAQVFPRAGGPDPVIDFLFKDKIGHCEYFATAMVLVARAAGIPARAVMGYRVGEKSPFGYYVVRERNAHAWVEAWVARRGWMTRDPTPDAELPQNRDHRASYPASLADAMGVGYDDVTDWLGRLTVRQTGTASAVGFAVLLWIVARGARRRAAGKPRPREDETALPSLTILLAALKQRGHDRPTHEALERFAERLPDRGARRLLERYAALRYGSIGDERALAGELESHARALR